MPYPEERADTHRKRSRLKAAAWILPAVLAIYVLSIGPVLYTAERAGWTLHEQNKILSTIYWPLGWLEDRSKIVGDFMNWYLDLWGLWDAI